MHGWSARLRQSAQPQKVSLVYYAQVTTSQQALQVVPGRQGTYKTQQALQTCTALQTAVVSEHRLSWHFAC